MRYFKAHPNIEVVVLLSNNPVAFALQRAGKYGVPTRVFTRQELSDPGSALALLREKQVTHIVLAGFVWLVPEVLLRAFPHCIINIHPALLPRYGGKGMYGDRVHEAVKESGDTESGITIHAVNERYDEGRILFQAKCPVLPTDSPEEIARKVHALEYQHYPRVIEEWIERA